MKYTIKYSVKIIFLLLLVIPMLVGCEKNEFSLQEDPPDELSETLFWNNEDDAERALRATYRHDNQTGWWAHFNGWNIVGLRFEAWSDITTDKVPGAGWPIEGITPSNGQVEYRWDSNYARISRANYFLENIDKVDMNEERKAEMIAEVKFLRAHSYFWLSQMYGDVPLVTKTLTFDEANSVSQSAQEQVVNFALEELTAASLDLPWNRPPSEKGRIEKGAALALMGRFLMAEERWSEAAGVYKEIMDSGRYDLHPDFKEVFEDSGENNNEVILAKQYMESVFGEPMTQQAAVPGWFGGYTQFNFLQNFVDRFPMVDGQAIDESPLYDPEEPFENRDPRLYATVLLPQYSVVNEVLYYGHPDSTSQTGAGVTGYGINKFYDHQYSGDTWQYGGDYPLIRYPEVLLGYLESKLKAGDNITQGLLDETINVVRDRADVGPVTVTNDPAKLMEIIRDERAIELALEGGIRYWDAIRWRIAEDAFSGRFYGMDVTDNVSEYDGRFVINDEGHIFIKEREFLEHYYLWPIPQSELDVNENLVQNPGYQ